MKQIAIVVLLALTACQTAEQTERNAEQHLNSAFAGRPLSDYIFQYGRNPENMFDMPEGRVFIFGAPCFSWWHTKRVGAGGTPAHFQVTKVEVRGYCG